MRRACEPHSASNVRLKYVTCTCVDLKDRLIDEFCREFSELLDGSSDQLSDSQYFDAMHLFRVSANVVFQE